MNVVVVGLGIQGKKRRAVAGADVVATVDPFMEADHQQIEEVPLDSYEAALLCVPDEAKLGLMEYLFANGKHVLVEKPLIAEEEDDLHRIGELARVNGAVCYTAYNHRFEPHIVRLKEILESGSLGEIYLAKFFYGNGTAREVRDSAWRDKGMGVLPDLGSHLLDWTLFLFGEPAVAPEVFNWNSFENRSPDYFQFGFKGRPVLQYDVTLLSWRNTFRLDAFAERGSVHIDSLCKWGPTTLTVRRRVLPSGRPDEESHTLVCPDPTWVAEYDYFKSLCRDGGGNLPNDLWINRKLQEISRAAEVDATRRGGAK